MDWGQLAAVAGSFVLGITAVWKIVEKFSPKVKRYISIASKSLTLLDKVLLAIEDKKIDEAEIAEIRKEAEALMLALKK
jgi:hypothetical protein